MSRLALRRGPPGPLRSERAAGIGTAATRGRYGWARC